MALVVYLGPQPEILTPAHYEPIPRGVPVELDDIDAGGLVGYGDGDWRYADAAGNPVAPVEVGAEPTDPVRVAALAGNHPAVEETATQTTPPGTTGDVTTTAEENQA